MDALDTLLDLEALKNLKAKYFRTLDTKDWEAFGTVFTDDVVIDTRPAGGALFIGRDTFLGFVATALGERRTVHHGHTPELELTSATTAAGVWAMEDWVRFAPGFNLHGFGHYTETYLKTDGEWRIQSSTLTRIREDIRTPFFSVHIGERMRKLIASRSASFTRMSDD